MRHTTLTQRFVAACAATLWIAGAPASGASMHSTDDLAQQWHRIATADLNGNGVVDLADVLMLLDALGPCPPAGDCPADLNRDGFVSQQDFLMLMELLGQEVPPFLVDQPGSVAVPAAQRPELLELAVGTNRTELLAPELVAAEIALPPTLPSAEPLAMPLILGYKDPAPPALLADAIWHDLDDGGQIARIELHSPQATALRVRVKNLGDTEVRVYDPHGEAVFGPYVRPRLQSDGTWWTTIIFGDTIGLELYRSPKVVERGDPLPEIVEVFYHNVDFHGFLHQDMALGDMDCYEDLPCVADWVGSIEANSVARLMGSTGCSAALLNRNPSDFAPMVMTARHCFNTLGDNLAQVQDGTNMVVLIWFWENESCDGDTPDLNSLPRNDGALALKIHNDSDFLLMGLYEPDASGNYSGWSSGTMSNGSTAFGVHHPGGLPKKFTSGEKSSNTDCRVIGSDNDEQHFIDWTVGATRPVASGSPLFDENRLVRGTLSCVEADNPCSPWSKYGRYDLAFPNLRWFLFDMANPTHVDGAVAGDPFNNGNSERGTAADPFNTFYEATFAVPSGGEILIAPGVYVENPNVAQPIRIWRPMTLKRWGDSGVVRIGAP